MPRIDPHPQAIQSAFGGLQLDRPAYRPLDQATVLITRRRDPVDDRCVLRACDSEQRPYWEKEIPLKGNQAQASFEVPGPLGNHYLYLFWPGEKRHSRFLNFQVDAETEFQSGDPELDNLFPFTRNAMRRLRRCYSTPRGRMVGYMSADTMHFDGIWLRDWIYGLPAYRFWETEMTCGLDRFFENQSPEGRMPDGIERDGRTWRVGLESDVEYITALGVWRTWQATGDDEWLRRVLPGVEKALRHITSDPRHWDTQHRLVKRQHSCDTWDFDIDGCGDKGQQRHVIATCDQSGYVQAMRVMGRMLEHVGRTEDAAEWKAQAEAYRARAVDLLWDGGKFLHHAHLDAIDHGDFDETQQLAMGNTWAMTRGMANGNQARAILNEYRRRHIETGDAYPWWSLQPGYPDRLGYFSRRNYCRQGGYANGGLMPWVGGELCLAAFRYGMEEYGMELLRAYTDHLRRTGGAQVWYWPDGTPGFRTPNEVPYAGWGMAEWVNALSEGLAGITDEGRGMDHVAVAPRWPAAGIRKTQITLRYAASDGFFAYAYHLEEDQRMIAIRFTGSGSKAAFQLLLPEGWKAESANLNGLDIAVTSRIEGTSTYADIATPIHGVSTLTLQCMTE